MNFLNSFIALVGEMAPYLLLGFLIAGVLHAFVPQTVYSRLLGRNDMRSVIWAALFGVPLPLCSCGVIPTAASMRREGASRAATVSFLISTPQTGVDSIAATASLLGLPFAVLRPVVAFVTALFSGGLVTLMKEDKSADHIDSEECQCEIRPQPKGFWGRTVEALRYGFIDMIQDIGKWLVVGLVIAGLITVLVPDGFFTRLNDYPILNMLVVLAIAAPMYLCATGSVPIAAALMLKGLSPGAALVLLMAGPATNMAAIMVIGKVLGRRTLAVYLTAIIVGAIGFGLGVDYLLPAEWFTVADAGCTAACHGATMPWWKVASSVVFATLLVVAFILRYCKRTKTNSVSMEQAYKIQGMMCNHCAANVQKALASVKGVESVRVELSEATAYITGSADATAIKEAISAAGYQVVE
ncbi:MAG: SO_0444 family Cu/Zn efflux transporter [Rikenellaceae bacterium]|nr:SO_0444 family Cu/Zn efflux transporter [Rikenellaceae bacterium]